MTPEGTTDEYELTPEEIREKFEDPQVRMSFIRKVMGILTGQLMFTFFFIFLTQIKVEIRIILLQHPELLIMSMVVTVAVSCAFFCCKAPRRKVPWNYILLAIFTICETILMCYFTMHFKSRIILYAIGITAVICFFSTLIACFSRWDFTSSGCFCFLAIMTLIMVIFGLVMIFVPHTPVLQMVFGAMGAGLFTLWLIFDIQMMIGGKHRNAISPEEYVFGALSIYMDVVFIFQYVLLLLDACNA